MAIIRRDGKYGVRVYDRRAQGQRWVGTFDRLKDAKRAEADATDAQRPVATRTLTVGRWVERWLKDYARPSPATRRTYKYATSQIRDDLGDVLLAAVDRPQARALASRWPRGTMRVARTMFGDAVRDGLIVTNPFAGLRLETPRGRKDLTALTEPEIRELADMAARVWGDYGDEARALVLTLAYTGLRPGELAALKRANLRLAAAELVVDATVDATGGEKLPKNGKPRVVTLPPLALRALASVPTRVDSSYVFHTARGRRLSKGSLSYLWRPVAAAWREKTGHPLDLYELRHACATLLLERGLSPADVALQLGHSDGGRLVMQLYGHPDEDRARDRLKMAFATDAGSERDAPLRRMGSEGVAGRSPK